MNLEGKRVVFTGAMQTVPRRLAKREAEQLGATVYRGITRKTDMIFFGRHSLKRLSKERIENLVNTADTAGAETWSENKFLEMIGCRTTSLKRGPYSIDQFLHQTRLDALTLRLLCLFDVFEPVADSFDFRDIVAGKQFSSLISDGQSWSDVVEVALARNDLVGSDWRSRDRLKVTRWGCVLLDSEEGLVAPNGQLYFDLAEDELRLADELFDRAEAAEENGDWSEAENLYSNYLRSDPRDAIAAFNLANVLNRQGKCLEAERYFVLAKSLDPDFAEAWYNLALINQENGLIDAARHCLGAALKADPHYADAIYNFGLLEYNAENYELAGSYWKQYLKLDGQSNWSRRAKQGIIVCDRMLAPR